jgi:hypothetical protein
MTIVSQSTLGINFEEAYVAIDVDTTPENPGHPFAYGTVANGTDGSTWVFGKIGTGFGVTQNMTVLIDGDADSVRACSSLGFAASLGARPGWYKGETALTAGMAAWFQLSGGMTFLAGTSCNAGVRLYTTHTSGVLDDAVVTGSHYPVLGVYLQTETASGAAATATAGIASFPFIGPTGQA